jgi:hypothetical protein
MDGDLCGHFFNPYITFNLEKDFDYSLSATTFESIVHPTCEVVFIILVLGWCNLDVVVFSSNGYKVAYLGLDIASESNCDVVIFTSNVFVHLSF